MAWIALTYVRASGDGEFHLNMDKALRFYRATNHGHEATWIELDTTEQKTAIGVHETPEEIIALVRKAEAGS